LLEVKLTFRIFKGDSVFSD